MSFANVREAIFDAIPMTLKSAVSVGIGLFIAFIGLQNAKIIVNSDSTLLTYQNFKGGTFHSIGITALLAIIGVIITGYLLMPSLAEAVAELRLSESYTLPLTVAVGLLVAGLGVKSAMFPFHLWLPDAHGGATTASSAILSGLVLKGYIVLLLVMILRVFSMELMVELGVTDVILAFGLLGMILGSLAAMRENHIKRMLAYSSVAQVGYIFMGVGLGSIEG